ncbi:BTB/POZ domain-containing protein [Cocos nucifera]|uniref:BTB/POZ domain-containing protein n=1 Tax=Cocos nucifera TaxID=13894 RepID=A0A8K0IEN1_COCNU|nr:BTB/POZ domain-containing protein [Cocos nucifera]
MAASAHLKTQSQPHPPRSKRRKRRETTIPTFPSPHVVSSDGGAWCCAASSKPHHHHPHPSPASSGSPPHLRRPPPPPLPPEPEPALAEERSPSTYHHSPSPARSSPGWASPGATMDAATGAAAFPAQPPCLPCYSKFNSALNAGLLNPMSPPPLDKTRSSPTLSDMMANEQEYHPSRAALPPPPPPLSACHAALVQDRQLLLHERIAEILGSCSPGNQFNDPDSSDVRLTLSSKDGVSVSLNVHRHILVAHSRFFAAKLSDHWSRQQRSLPHIVEISDCDDVEVYVETLRLMYCKDLRRRLMGEDVSKVLGILKVSAAIVFNAGVLSCLEYLEAAPWAEDEEEKVASLLSQLQLGSSGAGEVLKRVSLEVGPSSVNEATSNGSQEILVRLLQVVLEGKDEKARREMKGLVSKMLRENSASYGRGGGCTSGGDLSKESLYSACDGCLRLLRHHFLRAAATDLLDAAQIARQADNLHWILGILIDRQMADEFLRTWAAQAELSEAHSKVPAIHRCEVSRVTARLFVAVGKGQILVSKEARCLLLSTWLEPFYEDFGWMRRACKGLDRHLMEDGLANTILTLPLAMQQEILLAWFERFLNSGDDCPNIQRGFEVWWRRAFWRRNGEPEQPPQLRITAVCENS